MCSKVKPFTDRTISHQGLAGIWKRKRGNDPNNPRVIKDKAKKRRNSPKTGKETARRKLVKQRAAAKRSITVANKKLKTFNNPKIISEDSVEVVEANTEAVPASATVVEVNNDLVVTEDTNKDKVIFTPNPGPQTEFLAANEYQVLYGGAAGGGKEILVSSLIPTPYGEVLMRDIKVWDEVFDKDGKVCHVTSISDIQTDSKLVEFEFDDGTTITSCVDHQWLCHDFKERETFYKHTEEWRAKRRAKRKSRAKSTTSPAKLAALIKMNKAKQHKYLTPSSGTVRTTQEIVDNLIVRGGRTNFSIPLAGALDLPEVELLIHPYVLGLWLGDGTNSASQIAGIDMEVFDKIEALGYEVTHNKNGIMHNVTGLITDLRKLGLYRNKHVPPQYLRASKEQRLDLLKGLMDSDGTVRKETGHPSFTNTNEKIIDGAIEIICSLGWKVRKLESRATLYGKDCGPVWDLNFTPTEKVFHLPRKRDIQTLASRSTQDCRYIVKATPVPSEPSRCITVDSPSSTYLVGSTMQVTHNSYALLADPMRYFDNPNFRGLLVRKTNDELRELKTKSAELYPKAFPGAVWREKSSEWVFPSGARLWLTYLDQDADVRRYQGLSFTWVAFDELTQWPTPFSWNFLSSRIRTTDPTLPLHQRATTNPGGAGMGWVKKMFVDPAPAGQAFPAQDIDTGEVMVHPDRFHAGHPQAGQKNPQAGDILYKRKFIPASLYDNPYLATDGQYETALLGLPEAQRRQLLEGDWSLMEGAAFPSFRKGVHTITPYDIPKTWTRFRSCDYGYSSHTAVLWFAIDPAFDTLIVYRELYVSKVTAKALARMINEIEATDRVLYGVLDSSVWHNRGQVGPSMAEEMIAAGCRWRPSDRGKGSRTAGFNMLQKLLLTDEMPDGKLVPGIQIFETCRQLISDLTSIPISPKGVDDIDERYASDHTYDALRYGIMSRPKSHFDFGQNTFANTSSYRPVDTTFGY